MSPLLSIPASVRGWLYVAFGVGSVVMTYLGAKGVLGGEELALWSGLGVFFGATAAANVSSTQHPAEPPDDPLRDEQDTL